MSEKRRSARIQGGWAPKRLTKQGNASASSSKKCKESEPEIKGDRKTVFSQSVDPEKQLIFKPTVTVSKNLRGY